VACCWVSGHAAHDAPVPRHLGQGSERPALLLKHLQSRLGPGEGCSLRPSFDHSPIPLIEYQFSSSYCTVQDQFGSNPLHQTACAQRHEQGNRALAGVSGG
jgi:hypothetical protein